jgi:hypothetical protein
MSTRPDRERDFGRIHQGKDGWVLSESDRLALFCLGIMIYMSVTTTIVFPLIGLPEGILVTSVMFPSILLFAFLVARMDRERTWNMTVKYYDGVTKDASSAVRSALIGEGIDFESLGKVSLRRFPDLFYDDVLVLEDEGLEVVIAQHSHPVIYIGPTTLLNKEVIRRLKTFIDKAMS